MCSPFLVSGRRYLDLTYFEDALRPDNTGIGATLRKQKRQEILKHIRIGGVSQVGSFALHLHQIFVLQFLKVM
jgi:hypothetical protein